MQDQAASNAPRVLPAVAHAPVPGGFTSHLCPTCRGTGALGRHETLHTIADSMVVLTQTRWCPTCKGGGQVWQEARRTA